MDNPFIPVLVIIAILDGIIIAVYVYDLQRGIAISRIRHVVSIFVLVALVTVLATLIIAISG